MTPPDELTPEELLCEIAEFEGFDFSTLEQVFITEFSAMRNGKMEAVPYWLNDTDAALALFRNRQLSHAIEYDHHKDLYCVRFYILGFRTYHLIAYRHKKLAMALCMVYREAGRKGALKAQRERGEGE